MKHNMYNYCNNSRNSNDKCDISSIINYNLLSEIYEINDRITYSITINPKVFNNSAELNLSNMNLAPKYIMIKIIVPHEFNFLGYKKLFFISSRYYIVKSF